AGVLVALPQAFHCQFVRGLERFVFSHGNWRGRRPTDTPACRGPRAPTQIIPVYGPGDVAFLREPFATPPRGRYRPISTVTESPSKLDATISGLPSSLM